MEKPIRVQRKRTKDWRMPDNTISVCRPGKWGNPFKVGDNSPNNYNVIINSEHAVELFKCYCDAKEEVGTLNEWLSPLKGKNLACYCPLDKPCHADVLLELANA